MRHAQVCLAVRNPEKGKAAIKEIEGAHEQHTGSGTLSLVHLDMNSLASVRHCAATFQAEHQKLNILINNAGVPETNPCEIHATLHLSLAHWSFPFQ